MRASLTLAASPAHPSPADSASRLREALWEPPRRVLHHSHRRTHLPSWPGRENTLLPRSAPGQACRHGWCPPLSARPGHLSLPPSKWPESSPHPDLLHTGQPGPGGGQHGPCRPKTGPWRPGAIGHTQGCLSPGPGVPCRVRWGS